MTRFKIAVLDDYQNLACTLADWESIRSRTDVAEVRVINEHLEPKQLIERIRDCHAVVGTRERTPFPRTVLEQLPKLQLLLTTGMHNASFDVEAASKLGITVCGTGVRRRGNDTAELAWLLIMDLVRGVTRASSAMREAHWQTGTPGRRLQEMTIGILGLGTVGSVVAGYAQAFGCHTLAWSENLTEDRASAGGVEKVSKDELFRRSDVVTVHLRLSNRTRGVVTGRELGLLGPSSYLVNTARSRLVIEDDLIAALRSGTIAGAALDIFDVEPLPAKHPLRDEPRALLTPHLGYVTREALQSSYTDIVEDILAWLDGNPIRVIAQGEERA